MGHIARVYPHNDLLNLAHYHRGIIRQKIVAGNRAGIALDCTSCLIALAFSVEAIVNFVGTKKIQDWNERVSYKIKMQLLGSELGYHYDVHAAPFKTLQELKVMRDQLAHGKPMESTSESSSRSALKAALSTPWDHLLEPEFAETAYDDVKAFKEMVLAAAGIGLAETLTSGSGIW